MRTMVAAAAMGVVLAGGAAARGQSTTFSGVKLVDMKARTAERTVTLAFQGDALQVIDPSTKEVVATLAYRNLVVTHTRASAPPASAGEPSAAATQRASMPMYMGKTPRHWLTLQSSGGQATLRVSAKVHDQVKAALEEHRVAVHEQ